ncbi:MAG: M56 family metallopeptidase [Granulicella sp.]
MNTLEGWMLGYLLNSLWQVPVLFAAAWVVSLMARRMGPRAEHRVWVSALVLQAVLPACSWRIEELAQQVWGWLHTGSIAGGGAVRVTLGPGVVSGVGVLRLPAAVLAGIAITYGCGLLYVAGRLGWGLWRTGVMRRQAEPVAFSEDARMRDVRQRWERYSRVLGVRAAEMAVSPMTAGPVTVGLWRGVMLVPPGFLANVGEEDLDAVMAHELAHMRRRDFAKNVLYGFVTITVAYHPVLWMTRLRVAATREMVCDAMAAEAVAGREKYARSLLRLASLVAAGAPERTLHAIGIFDANLFERRVMKLTEKRVEMKGVRRIVVAVACVVMGVATCASALALRMEVGAVGVAREGISSSPRKIGGSVSAPQLVYSVPPEYTEAARKAKASGTVLLNFWVSPDGRPSHIHVVRGIGMGLDEKAIAAVRQYRFKPAMENGAPVLVELKVEVNFKYF